MPPEGRQPPRPFIGLFFECCSVYQRAYRSADGREYRARCPRCLRSVTLAVGSGGTDSRFFRVN